MTFEDWLREQLPRMVRFADALCGRSVSEEIVQDVGGDIQCPMVLSKNWAREASFLMPNSMITSGRPNRASPISMPTAPS